MMPDPDAALAAPETDAAAAAQPGALSGEQQRVLDAILLRVRRRAAVSALAGYAGTGKTFTAGRVIRALEAQGRIVQAAAPTHPACRVLEGKLGRSVSTLHSLLSAQPPRDDDRGVRIVGPPKIKVEAVVVIDEASMISTAFLDLLLAAATQARAQVIFVGDPAQLPPVGEAKATFLDRAGPDGVFTLAQIVRQGQDSRLPDVAARYRDRAVPFVAPRADEAAPAGGLVMRGMQAGAGQFLDAVVAGEAPLLVAYTNLRAQRANALARQAIYGARADREPYIVDEIVMASDTVYDRHGKMVLENSQSLVVDEVRLTEIPGAGSVAALTLTPLRPSHGQDDRVEVEAATPGIRAKLLGDSADAAYRIQEQMTPGLTRLGVLDEWTRLRRRGISARLFQELVDDDAELVALDADRREAWSYHYLLKDRFVDLRAPWASTVHKAQGRTVRDVYIDGRSFNGREDATPLAYVALTRAERFAFWLN